MGLWSGASFGRSAVAENVEERATYRAASSLPIIGTYAQVAVTSETAAQSVAIRSTTDLIASLGSELPIQQFTGRRGKERKEVALSSALEDPGGDDMGREDWGYRLINSWLMTGNSFGDIVDRDAYSLKQVDLLNGDDVTAIVVEGAPKFYVQGREVEKLSTFAHWRVNPISGRLLGLSPIEWHATTIGVSLATSRFGRQWFEDGAHPSGFLKNDEVSLTPEQAEEVKTRVVRARGTRDPMVLGKGWGWDTTQISPEESQFLETQGLSEAQCCRIYGPGFAEILGYDGSSGRSMTYANLVDRRQDLLVLSMNRWLRRYERILSKFVPRTQWVEINRDALLEATTLQRYQAHASALQNQWRTVNEVRRIENLEPVAWGDEPIQKTATEPSPAPAGSTDEPDPGA